MVTLRRDVAVMQDNNIFDRIDRDQFTDYDLFMQAKQRDNESPSHLFSSLDKFFERDNAEGLENISQKKDTKKEDVSNNTISSFPEFLGKEVREGRKSVGSTNIEEGDYDSYMLKQLNRTSPQKILSKEEYEKQKVAVAKKGFSQKGHKMSKRGKIFVVLYTISLIGISLFLALV